MQIRRNDLVYTSETIEVHIVAGFVAALFDEVGCRACASLNRSGDRSSHPFGGWFLYLCLFTQRWTDLLILGIIFAGIVAVFFLCVLLQETCDSLREKIRAL